MLILRDSSPVAAACRGAVIALGNFDGLHLGHQSVIGEAVARAQKAGAPSAVMTFEPHPRRVFKPGLPPLRILSIRTKIELLRAMNVDCLRIIRFTPAFAQTTAADFVGRILHAQLQVRQVVTGEDFTFGQAREGNTASLRRLAQALGFSAVTCAPVEVDAMRCSSTRIRAALETGDMERAARLLGRAYGMQGRVRHGDKRGRELGFPTANLLPPLGFPPALGIYAVTAKVRGHEVNGVASWGLRPNFPLTRPLLEVHLFDWQEDIYGERMEVAFLHYLRPERAFESVEALKKQMAEDVSAARRVLGGFLPSWAGK